MEQSFTRKLPTRFSAVIVLLIALFVRLLVLFQISHDPNFHHIGGDGSAYLKWAAAIEQGDWIGHEVFYQSPLYPYLIAIFQKLLGPELISLLAFQAFIGAVGCAILAIATRRWFDPNTGLLAGILLALYPAAISYDLQVDKTVLDTLLVAATLWFLATLIRRPTWRCSLLCGIVLGIFAINRENALALVLIIAVWLAWRCGAKLSLSLLAGAACVLIPIAARNTLVSGEFHLVTAQFGPNFYYGNAARADGIYFPLRPGRGDAKFERIDATEIAEQSAGHPLSPAGVSSYWTHRTLGEIAENPLHWASMTAKKFAMFWAATEIADADVHDRHIVFSLLLRMLDVLWNFSVLLPLALAGIVLTWDRRRDWAIVPVLILVYAGTITIFILYGRYRLPIVPMLMPFAAAALTHIRHQSWKTICIAGAAAIAGICIAQLGDRCIPERIRGTNPYNRAIAFASIGQPDEAITLYHRAIEENPRLEPAYANLSLLLIDRGQLDEAIRIAQQAIQLNPDDSAAHANLGVALAHDNRMQQAIVEFQRALQLDPGNRAVQNDLAMAMRRSSPTTAP
jgi:tetratricopeptide (TPR) repeat protein